MQVEGKTGIQANADGSFVQPRLLKDASLGTSDTHARFYEGAYRSKLWFATSAVGGVASQAAAALAASCAFALRNPTGSGVNAILYQAMVGYISGTMAVGTYVWASYAQGAAALGGTAITPVNAQLGSAATAQCTAGTGASFVAGSPTLLRGSALSQGAYAAGAASLVPQVENLDGQILVPPGQALVLFLIGATGTSEKLIYSLMWEEAPI